MNAVNEGIVEPRVVKAEVARWHSHSYRSMGGCVRATVERGTSEEWSARTWGGAEI